MTFTRFGSITLAFLVFCTACDSNDGGSTAAEVAYAGPGGEPTTVQAELDTLRMRIEQLETLEARVSAMESQIGESTEILTALTEGQSALSQSLDSHVFLTDERFEDVDIQVGAVINSAFENEQTAQALTANIDSLDGRITQLEAQLGAPRPCPDGTAPLSAGACVETSLREPTNYAAMRTTCFEAGRRACSAAEVNYYCNNLKDELEDPYETTGEWTSDLGGQYEDTGSYRASWAALGNPQPEFASLACSSVRLVGTESSDTVFYPYRCCYDRL